MFERIRRIGGMLLGGNVDVLRYALWLRLKGLDFSGTEPANPGLPANRMHEHAASGGPQLTKVLEAIGLPVGGQSGRIIDFGSGKGVAAITLSRHFAHVTGVEMAPELIAIARRNVARLRLSNIQFECADAGTYRDVDDKYRHIYMFNPFPAAVMQEVMVNLRQSLVAHPRPMTIIYKNPVCHDLIMAAGFVKSQEFFLPQSHPFFVYTANASGVAEQPAQ